MSLRLLVVTLLVFFSAHVNSTFAQEAPAASDPKTIVEQELQKRTKASGTLDIYDEKGKKVRHMKMSGVGDVQAEGEKSVVTAEGKDTYSKESVKVLFTVENKNGQMKVTKVAIGEVTKNTAPPKTFTDEELKQFANDALKERAEASGQIDIYDSQINGVRHLELVGLSEEIRKFGTTSILSAETKDKTSGETVILDITLENVDNNLETKKLKIKEVKK